MKQEMININANLVAEPTFSSFDKEGETVEVANFTLVKKYGKGKEYINCAAYGLVLPGHWNSISRPMQGYGDRDRKAQLSYTTLFQRTPLMKM